MWLYPCIINSKYYVMNMMHMDTMCSVLTEPEPLCGTVARGRGRVGPKRLYGRASVCACVRAGALASACGQCWFRLNWKMKSSRSPVPDVARARAPAVWS